MHPQFKILARFFPPDLEQQSALRKVKVFQRHPHQLKEVKLSQFVQHAVFGLLMPVAFMRFRLFDSERPYFQDVRLGVGVEVVFRMTTVQRPAADDRAEDRLQDLFEPGFDLLIRLAWMPSFLLARMWAWISSFPTKRISSAQEIETPPAVYRLHDQIAATFS